MEKASSDEPVLSLHLVFEGEAKHYLRLELFQLMLRHQLAAVQKAWGVPKEIEVSLGLSYGALMSRSMKIAGFSGDRQRPVDSHAGALSHSRTTYFSWSG